MFLDQPITGRALPDRTLCLTFDDGPGETPGESTGPHTEELAEYLAMEGVSATFFMVGRCMHAHGGIVSRVAALGHTIGNHTYHHAKGLPTLLEEDADIVSEIIATDHLIREHCPGDPILFRAPWGEWSAQVAEKLNRCVPDAAEHSGPYHWDIDTRDWAFWRDGRSADECAVHCLDLIEATRHGIVLMHDSTADLDNARKNNRTLETIRLLLPRLKKAGYTFTTLDKIP